MSQDKRSGAGTNSAPFLNVNTNSDGGTMAVNFDRAMIQLVREIRKRVSIDDKPGIKLANPDILDELTLIYFKSDDIILKTLIKELFERASDGWPEKLLQANETPDYNVKVYRGQVTLQDKISPKTPEEANVQRKKRVYRGRVVEA